MEIAEETLTTPDLRLDVTPGLGPRGLTGPLFARRALSQAPCTSSGCPGPHAEELPRIGTVLASYSDRGRREVLVAESEVLLGPHSGYLVRVLLDATERTALLPPDRAGRGRDERASSRWRLLILEDCGELLAADAKVATGQALARLLNLTDGLIGTASRRLS